MKKLRLLCAGIGYACVLSAQPSFQTSLQAGISLPLNSNDVNDTHAGKAIHFGNNLDYTFGNRNVRFGLGAYIGYINSLSTDNKYKEVGQAIAEKYRLPATGLTFNASSFKSTHILLGPVASFGSDKFNVNVWAKGGYGMNEPSRYAVIYKENGVVNNVYVNQGGENKNGLAYSAGAGIKLAISQFVGLLVSAGYFSTETDQVNYNFDREKGTAPKYYTASNQFVQASAGLQFTIGNPGKKINTAGIRSRYNDVDTNPLINARPDQKIKTKSNIKNDRLANNGNGTDPGYPVNARPDQKIKTKSNIKNDRLAYNGNDDNDSDSLLFTPEKIELRARVSGAGAGRTQLQSVDNYLTGFAYQSAKGPVLSQCGASAMPGDPIPGLDVKLKRLSGTGNDLLTTRTNKDGSFAFNNIAPGDYTAEAGNAVMDVTVSGNNDNVFKTLDVMGGSCGNTKENFIINASDKTFVEVIAAREGGSGMATGRRQVIKYEEINFMQNREAGSGMATGRRMHKPYRVADTDFDINQDKIYTSDGKLYAEVITSREAGSGMATGRRSTIVTGDVDDDGLDDNSIVSPRDAASGLPTGRRMHEPFVVTKGLNAVEIVSPRDAASGLPTGKRMHKPFVVTITDQDDIAAIVSPRDAASGLPTGRRQYQPLIVRTIPAEDSYEIVSPRDAASGLPTGRRQYEPLIIRIDPIDDSYEVVGPRDAASGLPTGKRMHKPFVITKELGMTANGEELVTYKIIHRDLAARNILLTDADEDNTDDGAPAGNWLSRKGYDSYKAHSDMSAANVSNNPLYEESGNSGVNPLFESSDAKGVNPLYQFGGTQGSNPLNEARTNLQVTGSNGMAHTIFIPDNLQIQSATSTTLAPYTQYELTPVKWMSPESIAARKGITESGIKKNEAAARKGITQSGIKKTEEAERKGWDGSVKGSGKGINEAGIKVTDDVAAKKGINQAGIKVADDVAAKKGINQSGIKLTDEAARKGWDGTVKGGSVTDNEAAARKGWDGTVKGGSIVQRIDRVSCADGTCAVEAIVEVDGIAYEAVITGVLKTKHDTAKNSVGNIR